MDKQRYCDCGCGWIVGASRYESPDGKGYINADHYADAMQREAATSADRADNAAADHAGRE